MYHICRSTILITLVLHNKSPIFSQKSGITGLWVLGACFLRFVGYRLPHTAQSLKEVFAEGRKMKADVLAFVVPDSIVEAHVGGMKLQMKTGNKRQYSGEAEGRYCS